ncbi:MAG: heparinase II/III family protein, partial [Planctomycetota bacterium]
PNDRPLLIGFNQWNDRHYKGLIANVRIYNYARTAEDLLAEYRAASARAADSGSAPFDFSKTDAAKHLPADYWEKQVPNKEGMVRWFAARDELLKELAPKKPITDQELFAEYLDLSFPGLEGVREAFGKGDVAGARKAFATFLMERFTQKEPASQPATQPGSWPAKVEKRCEEFLAGKLGPLRSSGVYYTFAPGEKFDFRTFDPTGMNNYDWTEINIWRPVQFLIEGYGFTGRKEFLDEAVRITQGWYDGYAGQGRANRELLAFDREGRVRLGNLGDAALEYTSWEHWSVSQGRIRRMVELAPYLAKTDEPEELAVRTTKVAIECLEVLEMRLPHYRGNFTNMIGRDTCQIALQFAFLRRGPEWFELGWRTATRNYTTDSFPDGSTKDMTEAYLDSYLTSYMRIQGMIEEYGETKRFHLDKEAFAKEHEKSFEWLLYTSMPDLSPPTFNSTYRRRGVTKDVVTAPLRQLDWCGREDLRWLATERAEGTPPEHTSYPFRTHDPSWAGIYAMRSDWGPKAVYLAVDFGPFGGAHGDPDYGSFNIFAYGSDLVVDPTCGVYGQPLHRLVDIAPQTHNAVMIDGEGQAFGATPGRPDWFTEPIRTWVTNSVFDAGWGTYRFSSGLEHARIVWFVKPGYFLLVDTFPGTGKHKVRQNFTLPPSLDPTVEGNAARTHKKRQSNLLILPADARGAPEIVKGRTEPMYEGWVMWDNVNERVPAPAVVYNFETGFPAGMETILYPTPGGEDAEVTVSRKASKDDPNTVLITVKTPEGEDQFVVGRSPGRHEFEGEGIVFEGTMAFVRRIGGKATSIGLLGGKTLETAEVKVGAAAPTDGSLEFREGAWNVGDGKDAIHVRAK